MNDTKPCMGGFCHLREKCAHHQTESLQDPAERMCEPGHEREMYFQPAGEASRAPARFALGAA